MAKGQASKGTGKKRMSNLNYKSRREQAWRRGETRKQHNARTQAAREAGNKKLRASGQLTPWETARLARQQRRAAVRASSGGQA